MLRRVLIGMTVFFLAVALAIAVFAWRLYHSQQEQALQDILDIECQDILKGCGNKQFSVRFDQVPQVMQPFNISVTFLDAAFQTHARKPEQATPEEIHASFGMAGMEMGMNRYRLIHGADGTWRGTITLPVCIQGNSKWNMLLDVPSASGIKRYQLMFNANGSKVL